MPNPERYHDIVGTAKEMACRAMDVAFSGLERLLVGRDQPNPKTIRDLGKSASQASDVSLTISGMNISHPPEHTDGES